MQQILPHLVEALVPLVLLAFAWLAASLRKEISARLKAGMARDAALELVTAAETVVRWAEQSIRPELAKVAATGKLTPESAAALKATAITALQESLSAQAIKSIEANASRLEAVLGRSVEAAVNRLPKTLEFAELKEKE